MCSRESHLFISLLPINRLYLNGNIMVNPITINNEVYTARDFSHSSYITQTAFRDIPWSVYNCYSDLEIYTDGSKKAERVGFGFCVILRGSLYREFRFRLPDGCTVFQAEAMAVLQALSFIENSGFTNVQIITDSMSVLKALNSFKILNNTA